MSKIPNVPGPVEKAFDVLPEPWMKAVAVTTVVLAVCASVAGSRGTTCMAKTELLTSLEADQWNFYQAKSLKQNILEMQQKLFEVQAIGPANPQQQIALDNGIKDTRSEIQRYQKERTDVKAAAEKYAKDNKTIARQATQYSLAVVFLQIGIMLSSVSALVRKRWMWGVGIVAGAVGIVFLANGFFLFFGGPSGLLSF